MLILKSKETDDGMVTQIDGIRARYETEGGGKDVVLLHGWGGRIESMRPVFDALKTGYRVTAVDFPAHGESGAIQGVWGVDEFADFTVKLLDKLKVFPCHVVAHSFGGRVALLAASQRPELFGKLVLTGCAGLLPKPTVKARLRRTAYAVFSRVANDALKNKLRDKFSSRDYKALSPGMKKTFVKVINQDLRGCLPQIRSSTLLIWGSEDQETPLSFGRIMEKEIPDAGLVVFEGAGHFAYLERAADFNRIVSHFLADG